LDGYVNKVKIHLAALFARFLSPKAINALRIAKAEVLFEKNPKVPDKDLQFSIAFNFVQEMQFTIDALPEIQRILSAYPKDSNVKLLDFGPGFGAGANLLAQLYSSNFLACKLRVDALDIKPQRSRLARLLFPNVNYMTGMLEEYPDNYWQIIYCSNVIEHTTEPAALLRLLTKKAKDWVIVLAPYEERLPLSPGHYSRITLETFKDYNPTILKTFLSPAWQSDQKQVIAVIRLNGNHESS